MAEADYAEIIQKFWKEHSNWSINTEVVNGAVKATISRWYNGTLIVVATAHATINLEIVEDAENQAIVRAISFIPR
jgi:hypothetical protein